VPNEKADIPHVLDDPPPVHSKLLDYGERPYWSADGSRIAFIEQNYGDACEIDLATDTVRGSGSGVRPLTFGRDPRPRRRRWTPQRRDLIRLPSRKHS